jgi:hypothetical protein
MKEDIITYFGQKAKVACDGKCEKAWGRNNRPSIHFDDDDDDDNAFLSDDELGDAPEDPGTYEGGHAKPINNKEFPNKWCVRECERCVISKPGKYNETLILKDFSKRRYNQPWKH